MWRHAIFCFDSCGRQREPASPASSCLQKTGRTSRIWPTTSRKDWKCILWKTTARSTKSCSPDSNESCCFITVLSFATWNHKLTEAGATRAPSFCCWVFTPQKLHVKCVDSWDADRKVWDLDVTMIPEVLETLGSCSRCYAAPIDDFILVSHFISSGVSYL